MQGAGYLSKSLYSRGVRDECFQSKCVAFPFMALNINLTSFSSHIRILLCDSKWRNRTLSPQRFPGLLSTKYIFHAIHNNIQDKQVAGKRQESLS